MRESPLVGRDMDALLLRMEHAEPANDNRPTVPLTIRVAPRASWHLCQLEDACDADLAERAREERRRQRMARKKRRGWA
jgi:hypothetical protein